MTGVRVVVRVNLRSACVQALTFFFDLVEEEGRGSRPAALAVRLPLAAEAIADVSELPLAEVDLSVAARCGCSFRYLS
jgi:hypothetical protein